MDMANRSISGISVKLVSDVKWDYIKYEDKKGTAHRQGQKITEVCSIVLIGIKYCHPS